MHVNRYMPVYTHTSYIHTSYIHTMYVYVYVCMCINMHMRVLLTDSCITHTHAYPRDTLEQRVVLQLPQQDALCHHDDLGP